MLEHHEQNQMSGGAETGNADLFIDEVFRPSQLRPCHHSLDAFVENRRGYHDIRAVEIGIDCGIARPEYELDVSCNQ